jgi:hypothetical protein
MYIAIVAESSYHKRERCRAARRRGGSGQGEPLSRSRKLNPHTPGQHTCALLR